MAPRTINQRIAVQGGPEVARQLSDMARAGQEAFAKIRLAAEQTKNIKLPVEEIKKQLVEVGEAGQKAFEKVGKGSKQAAADTNAAAGFFSTLAGRITITAAAVVGLATAYAATANSASQAVVALGRQADVAKLSIENFQNLRGALGQLNLTADQSSTAMGKLRDAIKESFDEGKKALDAFGIRFAPVREQTQAFGAEMEIFGTKFIAGRTGAHSLAEAIQALSLVQSNSRTQLSETSRALLAMGAIFDPLTGKVKEGSAAWIPFAEGVRKMKDEAAQAKLVTAIFGEDIARTLLPAIRKGSDEFVKAFEGIRRLNLGFEAAERKVGQDFVNAWERLTLATKQSRTEMGLAFAPLFTPGINLLADALRRNQSSITNFAAQINKVLGPAIASLFQFLSNKLDTPGTFDALRDGIISFGRAISQIFTTVIIPAFNSFRQAAVTAAEVISRVFGTNVSPALVAVGAVVVALLGPFNALALAVGAIFGGEGAGFDAFREKLASVGIDIDALKEKLTGVIEAVIAELPGIIETVKTVFSAVKTTLEFVANTINTVFGTNVTAAGLAVVVVIGSVTGAFGILAAVLVPIAVAMSIVATGMLALASAAKVVSIALGAVLIVFKIIGAVVAGLAAIFTSPAIALAALVVALAAVGVAIFLLRDQIVAAFAAAWDFVVAGASALVGLISDALSGLADILTAPFKIAADIIRGIWQGLLDLIRQVIAAASGGTATEGGGGGGFARGGYTGSIGARRIAGFVHGNEYVQPAHVVRQPGVLGFLELLRRTGGDLEAAIARFSRGYSMGGFVDGLNRSLSQLAIPSFASGGFAEAIPARAGRDLGTIGLDFGRGGQVKVVGDEMTFDSLQRVSVRLARLSAGKKY